MRERSGKTTGMASTSGQRDDDVSHYFTSKTPHFFKVLFEDAIQHGKLKIPAKFVRDYGSGISSPVSLKVPSGAIWKAELTKSNAEIWLQSGWREFVEHHSLVLQDFVVFRYQGNSLFDVIIFNKGASEIKYPTTRKKAGGVHNFNGQYQGPAATIKEEQDTSVEILDNNGMPPSKKRRGKSPLPCPQPSKKRKIHSNTANRTESKKSIHNLASNSVSEGIRASDSELKVPKSNGSSPNLHTQGISAGGSITLRKRRSRRIENTIRGKEKEEALQRASSSFKSQNPFFKIVIQPSFVIGRSSLPIPVAFGKQYLMNQLLRKVICVVDGKSWDMELEIRDPTKKSHLEVKLCKGWKEFLHDNKLDVGDVCVFELVKSTKITFKVVEFRKEVKVSSESLGDGNGASQVKNTKTEAQKSPVPRGNYYRGRHRKTDSSSNFASDYPNFKVLVRSGSLAHHILNVPNAFVRRYIEPKTRLVTLQVAERSWLVQLISYSTRSCLSRGWSEFVKENSVRKNDICVFELVNRSDAVLRVSIFKHGA